MGDVYGKCKSGKFLAQCRKAKKLSQEKLGELLNYSKSNISKWETGESFPNDPKILMKIAEVLDVKVEEIIYGEKKDEKNNQNVIDSLVEEYKNKYNSFKKASLNLMIAIVFIIVLLFLLIYYIFIRGSVSVYSLSLSDEDFFMKDSVLVLSNSFSTLNFNKIESTSENIENIHLYYIDEDGNEITIFSGKNNDYYIEEDNGYNEYNLLNINKNELYLKIKTSGKYIKTKVICKKRYINNNIFPKKNFPISKEESSKVELGDNGNILLNHGFSSDDGTFYYKNIHDLTNITIDNYRILIFIEDNDGNYETLRSSFNENVVFYSKVVNGETIYLEDYIPDKDKNCEKSNCNTINDFVGYIYYLKNILKNGTSD